MNIDDLKSFEKEIADLFNSGKIKAPIHLYDGNEQIMIDIFENFINRENDWVCCTWRNHYQALLKGIPPDRLRELIINGKSMVMNIPEHKFICSSIVGGIPSIATGIALANKIQENDSHVWCWLGDMSAETGHFHEAYKYSIAHNLKITFVIEDNGKSVCTPTDKVWGSKKYYLTEDLFEHDKTNAETINNLLIKPKLLYYQYNNNKYPHAGAGVRVQF